MLRSALLMVAMAFVGPALVGCKTVATLKQRCLAGDTSACESACAKGVPGEGGCFHAGNQHREKASLDYAGGEFRRASQYFVRSCDGGYGDGCLLAAELIEAPYAVEPAAWGKELPKMISDAEVRDREKRLGQACARGSARGCKRLGDAFIGKNADRAIESYRKACDKGAATAECRAARAVEVAQADKWRVACTHDSADDCARLGDLLYRVDPPRGLRLFASECELRGVAELVGGVVEFVRTRATSNGGSSPVTKPAVGSGPPRYRFDVVAPEVNGPLAVAEVLHVLASAQSELSACAELDPHPAYTVLDVALVVDATGDVFRGHVTGAGAPLGVLRCLEGTLEASSFSRPAAAASVKLGLRISLADSARSKTG